LDALCTRLDRLIQQWRLEPKDKAWDIADDIYRMSLKSEVIDTLWDEPVLLGLVQVTQTNAPASSAFEPLVRNLERRAWLVSRANDIFYKFIDRTTDLQNVAEALACAGLLPSGVLERVDMEAIRRIRVSSASPATKVNSLLDLVTSAISDDETSGLEVLKACARAVNLVVVHEAGNVGLVLPIKAKVQPGSGELKPTVPMDETFVQALERARQAVRPVGCSGGCLSTVL